MEKEDKGAFAMPEYVWKALTVLTGLVLVGLICSVLKTLKNRLGRFVLHGLAGVTSLITANTVAAAFGCGVAVNAASLAVSGLLGVPGVGLLYALRYAVLGV